MLPRPSCPRAVQSRLWQNWACGSIGVPREAGFGDHAWRNAGWTRVFQAPTPASRLNGSLPCPGCRDVASFQAHRPKTFTTLLGDVGATVRPYYHCPHCHSGSFPGDKALGLAGGRLSAGAEQVVTLGGTLTSFAEAATKILPK